MGRHRSKSTVREIASEIVTHPPERLRPENESHEARSVHNPILPTAEYHSLPVLHRQRAQSLPQLQKIDVSVETRQVPLYPFLEAEEEQLAQTYLAKFSYNSVLDSELINQVNNECDDALFTFRSDCKQNIDYLKSLETETEAITANLASLNFHYNKVMKETEQFAKQSTMLLEKQKVLGKRAAEMDHVMKMFEPLESITKTLSSSGNNIIKNGRIMTVIQQIQECLDFFKYHTEYKDAEVYTMRYRQCMTRALTLLKNYNVDFLKAKLAELSMKLNTKQLDSLTLDIIMYSEFTSDLDKQTEHTRFSMLVDAIVSKCADHEEYKGLLSEVLQQYFRIRLILVSLYVQKQQSASKSGKDEEVDLVQHCQKNISSFKRLLEKEYSLFLKFFPQESYSSQTSELFSDELYAYFKQVLDPFYDEMRRRVLKESKITELCQLTNLLASYYQFEDEGSVVMSRSETTIDYGELFEPILQDSQARLIFRIQNYLDNKLLKYKPSPEDLQLGNRKESGRRNSILDEFEENLFPDLYVPVGKALTILSNIYELVNSMVFDDIAHYIIHCCIDMLKNGALKLAVAHLGPVDAKLFYLKNLTMLKMQLNNFDIQFVRTETSLDLTGGIQELIQIFRAGQLNVTLNAKGGFLELVKRSAPKVISNMIDAKHEIELELSNAVNDFVTESTNVICGPILTNEIQNVGERAHKLSDNVLMKIPQIHTQIYNYIEEDEVVTYLLNAMSRLVFTTYESYYQKLEQQLRQADNMEALNEVMEPDAFYNFVSETITGLQESVEEQRTFDRTEDLLDSPEDLLDSPELDEAT